MIRQLSLLRSSPLSTAPLMKALDNISRADDAHHAIKAFISACGIGSRSSWT